MAKNLMAKSKKFDSKGYCDNPYEIWQAGDWEWRVLKKWQADDYKPYARWFCAVKSPMTYDSWDVGDCYAADIMRHATKTFSEVE